VLMPGLADGLTVLVKECCPFLKVVLQLVSDM
jgi:hypothetical protein